MKKESLIPLLKKYEDEIHTVDFTGKLVGSTFIENAQAILKALLDTDSKLLRVTLERDFNNKFDKNAVKIILGVSWCSQKYHVGYIGKDESDFFAHILDGNTHRIVVEDACIIGGQKEGYNCGLRFQYRVWKN